MLQTILVICAGASIGAVCRWMIGIRLNPLFPMIPPGTLVANLIGGYCIGVAIALLALHPEFSPAWRLFVIVGLLGGLTTFSTFSAEVASLILERRIAWAFASVAAHVVGSLSLTALGIATVSLLH